jgi:hypothetical protein
MKVLVIGGMHGNETLGIELVKSFQADPVDNVDVLVANEEAIAKNVRFVEQDLNRSFPGDVTSKQYELQRAAEIIEACKNYDIVFDFHNTYCSDNDCSFLGQQAKQLLYDASSELGLNRIIIADYDCLNKYASNCLSVEISMDSKNNNVEVWRNKITAISQKRFSPMTTQVATYQFVYRMTLEDKEKFKLMNRDLKAFVAMDRQLSKDMGLEGTLYPIFINDKFTPYNFGGLLRRIEE